MIRRVKHAAAAKTLPEWWRYMCRESRREAAAVRSADDRVSRLAAAELCRRVLKDHPYEGCRKAVGVMTECAEDMADGGEPNWGEKRYASDCMNTFQAVRDDSGGQMLNTVFYCKGKCFFFVSMQCSYRAGLSEVPGRYPATRDG